MYDFENKRTAYGDVHYSRIICSWLKSGGIIYGYGPIDEVNFKRWLRECCHCTDDEVHDIYLLATNGKLEYEDSAKKFLKDDKIAKEIRNIKYQEEKEFRQNMTIEEWWRGEG